MSETTDGASKVGLGDACTLDLSKIALMTQVATRQKQAVVDSKSNKKTGSGNQLFRMVIANAGTLKNGKGYTMTFW